jgi:NAD(P)-dependent dehydrogenase (short-subunit alcohol dehydrogenase family)
VSIDWHGQLKQDSLCLFVVEPLERVVIVTGASRGLGLALARTLARRGWGLVIDARGAEALESARMELEAQTGVVAFAGDVTDENHLRELVAAAERFGRLDALVNNASLLGPSPQPLLADYPLDVLEQVYRANVFGPLRLIQLALPLLSASGGRIVNVTSDAGVEGYEGWGGYGSSKAALEQLSNVLAAERPDLPVYWVDPGDMNTQMHQEAYPGEDISDRPPPEDSVPGLLRLLEQDPPLPSGRYRARDVDGVGS